VAVFTGAGGAVAAQSLRLAYRRITFWFRLCRHGLVGLHDDFLDALQRSERAGAVKVLALIPGTLDGRSLVGAGGYHLKGESTDGKTTTMKVAASVCGGMDFWHTWRSTGNALEAGNIAYMLANDQGKARARTDGSVRETSRRDLLFQSTEELSLVEHAANAGERTYAGVEVRMILIPSDSGI